MAKLHIKWVAGLSKVELFSVAAMLVISAAVLGSVGVHAADPGMQIRILADDTGWGH